MSITPSVKTPSISVIIPCHNCEAFLAAAIDSVIGQTYSCFEIIAVNDGSTDCTAELLAGYGNKVTVIHQSQSGPAKARNVGIEHASGDLIAFLDSDDTWMPNKLQKAVEIFQNTSVAMIFTNISFVDSNGQLIRTTNVATLDTETIRRQLLRHCFIVLSSVVIKRNVLNAVGMFDTALSYGEDWDLFYKIAREYQVANCTELLTRYYLSENSMMRKTGVRERLINDTLNVFDRIYSYSENASLKQNKNIVLSDYFLEFGESDVWCGDYDSAKKYLKMSLLYNNHNTRAIILYGKLYLKRFLSYTKLLNHLRMFLMVVK